MRDRMDPATGRALEGHFARMIEDEASRAEADWNGGGARRSRTRTVFVTAAVGALVALVAVLAIQVGHRSTDPAVAPPTGAATTTRPAVDPALLQLLPKQPYGRVIHTWTDRDASSTSGPFSFIGSTAVIAAVCDGGGAIEITDTSGARHKEGCTRLDVQQPFSRFNLGGDGKSTRTTGPVHVTVKVLSGSPRYIVRLWAVDPRILDADQWSIARTSASVPASLRTCGALDLAPTGSVEQAAHSSGVVEITSRSTTDCAIRSWPTLQYVGADGGSIGPVEAANGNGMSLNSGEGELDRYGQFPPARLTAGGSAWFIVDLVRERELQQEDEQQRDAPTPTPTAGPSLPRLPLCAPERVSTLRIGIGSAIVLVPVPRSAGIAACTSDTRVFGVNPVVTTRPTVE